MWWMGVRERQRGGGDEKRDREGKVSECVGESMLRAKAETKFKTKISKAKFRTNEIRMKAKNLLKLHNNSNNNNNNYSTTT